MICDPPAFAPSKQALGSGLRAYEKLAKMSVELVEEGGVLVLCSCSHAASLSKFREACIKGVSHGGRRSSIIFTGFAGPDHPVHPMLSENGYLKSLFSRYEIFSRYMCFVSNGYADFAIGGC